MSSDCCPHCGAEPVEVLIQCPGCGRDGCDECIPGGRGVLCPDCEEAREDGE